MWMEKNFYHIPVTDKIFEKMYGVSFKENPYISRDDLRYVKALFYGFDCRAHCGEMVVNKAIADSVVAILEELFENKYQIERMELIDEYGGNDNLSMEANNSSAFNYRYIAGTGKLSNHAFGMAVDINPFYNPYIREGADGCDIIEPQGSEIYADRTRPFAHKIDHEDLAYRLFTRYGFEWGGDWEGRKDYQHFEHK